MIKFGQIKNLDKVKAYLAEVPRGVKKAAVLAIAEYMVGDDTHGFKKDQPYKYVSRASAYGNVAKDGAPAGYFSWKQFRFVMAAISKGDIVPGTRKYSPTQASESYAYTLTNGGYGAQITGNAEGAYWTRDNNAQPRQLARVGWRKAADVISTNIAGAIRHATAAVSAALRERKK